MRIGIVGLGRMGANIARRLMRAGHACVVYDVQPQARDRLAGEGAEAVDSLQAMVKAFTPGERIIWLMLPAGEITQGAVDSLGALLGSGDIIVDGGNAFYKDDVQRAQKLKTQGVAYLDAGTSGGVWGLERGFCLMIGGERESFERLDPIFKALAPGRGEVPETPHRQGRDSRVEEGYMYCGPVGSGRFVKMIHNGIEYGLMQAYAEGFDIMRGANGEQIPSERRYDLDLADIAELWRRGSVISSWLLDLSAAALAKDPQLDGFSGVVADSGEGRWTVQTALEEGVCANVLSASLFERFRTHEQNRIADKLLSAMRLQFGGHVEPKS